MELTEEKLQSLQANVCLSCCRYFLSFLLSIKYHMEQIKIQSKGILIKINGGKMHICVHGLRLDAYTLTHLRNKALYINLEEQSLSYGVSQYHVILISTVTTVLKS